MLNHKNIVKFIDWRTYDHAIYLMIEYANNGSLEEFLDNNDLSE